MCNYPDFREPIQQRRKKVHEDVDEKRETRNIYTNDDKSSYSSDKIKTIVFKGTFPEEYVSTLVKLQRANVTLKLLSE